MIRRLIIKEILTNLLSLRLSFAFLILLPLVSVSVYVLCSDYAQRQKDYDAKVDLHRQAAATDRVRVDRPLSPLMALIGGATVTTGNTIHLSYYDAPRIKGGFDHTPIFYIFSRTDYVFIIGIVMSLLALLFSYDAVAGEHERGTLRLVLSNAVPRDIVLLSKWVGGYLSAFFPTTIALLLGIIVFAGHPSIELSVTDWWAIVFVLLTAWVYLAVFFSLGVFISAISPTMGNAAMRCLFIWLLFVLIIPNAAPHIARRFAPTPSIQEMERKYDRIVADIAENRHEDHVVASKQVSNTKKPLRNISWNSAEYEEFQRIHWRIHCKILDIEHLHLTQQRYALRRIANVYESQLQKQTRLAKILSFFSPYAVFTDVATTLANTNGESQTAFLKMARQYEDDYFEHQYAEKRVIHHFLPVSDAPLFRLAVPSLQERMRQCLPGMVLLVILGVLFFMASYFLFLRRQV
jgi:ABC-type transport system involved in multi-copper enzyme maturation permease subunit